MPSTYCSSSKDMKTIVKESIRKYQQQGLMWSIYQNILERLDFWVTILQVRQMLPVFYMKSIW